MKLANPVLQRATPRVSVVIPTCNRARLVTRAIDSVLRQTFDDFELIVVDDASTDGTVDAVGRYRDPRLRLLRLAKNQGLPGARNAGISNARGEWVAFLDDDDEWLPEKLERQMTRVDEENDPRVSVVYCRCYRQLGTDQLKLGRRKELPEGDILDHVLSSDTVLVPSVYVVKRSALIEVGLFDRRLPNSEDRDCWLKLAQRSHRFVAVQERLAIKHEEHHQPRLSADPIMALRASRIMGPRWGRLGRERMGEKGYRKSQKKAAKRIEELHEYHVARLASTGSRADAWNYVRSMLPSLPWGSRYVANALAVGVLGGLASRSPVEPRPFSSSLQTAADERHKGNGPRVSVVIPTYNRAPLLPRAIGSVLAQTFQDFELIVVDDASTDETADVVRRYEDPRVRLVTLPENVGVSKARNAGIAPAHDDWVAFLVCDVEWLPEKLDRQMARIDRDDAADASVVYCRSYRQRKGRLGTGRRHKLREGDVFDRLLKGEMPVIPSVYVIKRDALLDVGGFDEGMPCSEDVDCLLRLAQRSHRFAMVDEWLVVKHNDHDLHRLNSDPFAAAAGAMALEARWSPVVRERLGLLTSRRRARKARAYVDRRHELYVGRLAATGSRSAAWDYVRRMAPALPSGAGYVARAAWVGIFGRHSSAPPRLSPLQAADRGREGEAAGGPEVSVVIPTRNRALLLRRAIDSVLAQTFHDFELIVVDDASEDDTSDVVRAIPDPRIRLIRLPRRSGGAKARNAGILKARGTWVAFLDCDDEWLPRKLELQLAAARNGATPDARVVLCRTAIERQDGTRRENLDSPPLPRSGQVLDRLLLREMPLTTSAYVVRRDTLIEAGGFDETLASSHDLDLWLRLANEKIPFCEAEAGPLVLKHHDHAFERIGSDPIAKLRGHRSFDARWGPLMVERLGAPAFQRSQRGRSKPTRKLHQRYVDAIAASGSRADAWRYVRVMAPMLPWGAHFIAKALAVGVLGGLASRGQPAREQDGRRNGHSPLPPPAKLTKEKVT